MVILTFILPLVLISTFSTSILINRYQMIPIRASSLMTILLACFLSLTLSPVIASAYSGAALGGSFVGMTDTTRLRTRGLILASILFSLCYYFILPLNKGFGGILGFFAFISCLITYKLSSRFTLK